MDENHYREIIERANFGYANHRILTDEYGNPIDYVFLEVNEAFETLTGLKKSNVLGKKFSEIIPIKNALTEQWIKTFGVVALEQKNIKFEQYSSNLKMWYRVEAFSKVKNYFSTIFFDITEEKTTIDELNGFFDVNLDLLCIVSIDGIFLKLNKEWENVLGYKLDRLVGRNFIDFIHPDDVIKTEKAVAKLRSNIRVSNFINRYRTENGKYRYIEWCSYPKGDKVYAAARDITEQIKIEQNLIKLSIRDPLTNIYNRRYIFDRLKEIEAKHKRVREDFSIAIIDLDKFKLINDNYGHLAGDNVLKEFSKIILEQIRPFDLFGRFGGEEFILVFLNCTKYDAGKRIEDISNNIKEKVFEYKTLKIKLTFSCGISDNKDSSDIVIDKLIDIADNRLYFAKDNGRDMIIIEEDLRE